MPQKTVVQRPFDVPNCEVGWMIVSEIRVRALGVLTWWARTSGKITSRRLWMRWKAMSDRLRWRRARRADVETDVFVFRAPVMHSGDLWPICSRRSCRWNRFCFCFVASVVWMTSGWIMLNRDSGLMTRYGLFGISKLYLLRYHEDH